MNNQKLPNQVNNLYYQTVGDKWYKEEKDPIALLRAESRTRTAWVKAKLSEAHINQSASILDIGCGGGFLANELAKDGYNITGLDLFQESLNVAASKDDTKNVKYVQGDAYHLPFEDESYDVVCMMDFLEHVEDVNAIIKEATRVLKPNGLCFFHTFNRNFLSWLFVIKGVEWFVKNTPPNLHVYHLFIKPKELLDVFNQYNCKKEQIVGLRPKFLTKSFAKMICTGGVDNKFEFKITPSLLMGYSGFVKKAP